MICATISGLSSIYDQSFLSWSAFGITIIFKPNFPYFLMGELKVVNPIFQPRPLLQFVFFIANPAIGYENWFLWSQAYHKYKS